VKQKVELLEAIIGFETKNKYVIKNSLGQPVYKVNVLLQWPLGSKGKSCSYLDNGVSPE
jgi:hypothetical protein